MQNYLAVGQYILQNGVKKKDRTGTGTRSVRKVNMTFDLREGFPLVTTKKVKLSNIIHELLWFLKGRGDNEWLVERGCNIWTPWATKEDKTETVELTPWERLQWLKENKKDKYDDFELLRLRRPDNIEEAIRFLNDHGVPTTRELVTVPAGSLNAPYGPTWRRWVSGTTGREVDQVQLVVDTLRNNPDSRRIIVNSWDSGAMPDESISPQENVKNGEHCLTPCHFFHEMYSEEMTVDERLAYVKEHMPDTDKKLESDWVPLLDVDVMDMLDDLDVPKRWLDMCVVLRSNDIIIGAPYNIASYAALLHMYAATVGMVPRILDMTSINAHIYENHIPMFIQQYSRTPRALPTLKLLNKRERMEDYVLEDFELTGYDPYDPIKAPIAV